MALYATGDIHGDAREFAQRISGLDEPLARDDVLICLGDVGIKYGRHCAHELLDALSSLPCVVLVMRGNHDIRYWRDLQNGTFGDGSGEYVEWRGCVCMRDPHYPRVLYLPDDGGALTLDGHRCLVVPGAWSIDGKMRRMGGLPYEPDEQLTFDERMRILDAAAEAPVEYVFSHTCPQTWLPALKDLFLPVSQRKTDKTMEAMLDEVLRLVYPTCEGWYFGHYHDDRDVYGIGHMLMSGVRKVF